jgi:hypothetical protein
MLQQLRQRAGEALASARQVVLSAYGPADIQAEVLPCEAVGLTLYVLVSRTSDLLFNLETNKQVVATADSWQMRGEARLLLPAEQPDQLTLIGEPAAAWSQLIVIHPTRLYLPAASGRGQGETIDIW